MRAQGAVAGCCCLLLLLLLASTASGQSGASDRGQALPVGSLPSAVVSFLSHFFFLRGPFFPANKFNKEEKTNKHTNRSPAIMDRQTKSHRPRATSRRWGRSADRGASNLPPTSWSPGTQRYFLAPSLSLSLLSLSLSLFLLLSHSCSLPPPTHKNDKKNNENTNRSTASRRRCRRRRPIAIPRRQSSRRPTPTRTSTSASSPSAPESPLPPSASTAIPSGTTRAPSLKTSRSPGKTSGRRRPTAESRA